MARAPRGGLGGGFALLWLSETAFDLGAALTAFALGVWVFQKTGSAEDFSWVVLAHAVPALMAAPLAGALAEAWDRRWVILGCDSITAALVLMLAVAVFSGTMDLAHLYVFNAATAVTGALRNPAYLSAMTTLVPKEALTRAHGVVSFSQAILQVGVPLVAGVLLSSVGLGAIMLIEIVLVLAGAAAAFGAVSSAGRVWHRIERPRRLPLLRAIGHSFGQAVGHLRRDRLLAGLLAYVALQDGLMVLCTTMIAPLVLSTHGSEVLGFVLSAAALGGMAGSALMIVLKVHRRLMLWVLVGDAVMSASVAAAGLGASTATWCACAFLAMAAGSVSMTCSRALWMRKTPDAQQGGVFACVDAIHLLAASVTLVLGGMVGQRLFEPALLPGGGWGDSVGAVMGVGPGRGIAFLFVVCGLFGWLVSMLALAMPGWRRLDEATCD